jgi:hypothetical protein
MVYEGYRKRADRLSRGDARATIDTIRQVCDIIGDRCRLVSGGTIVPHGSAVAGCSIGQE